MGQGTFLYYFSSASGGGADGSNFSLRSAILLEADIVMIGVVGLWGVLRWVTEKVVSMASSLQASHSVLQTLQSLADAWVACM